MERLTKWLSKSIFEYINYDGNVGHMRIKKQLEKLGLTEREAKTYASLLNTDNGSVLDIAKDTGLAKSTAHDSLNSLVKKGLVHKYTKGKRSRFTIADPTVLLRKTEEKNKIAQSILPELNARYIKSDERPRVQFYEGEEELEKVFNQIIEEADTLIGITSPEQTFARLTKYFPKFPKRRAKAGIPFKAIFGDSPVARERKVEGARLLRTTKLIKTKSPFASATYIWKNKVAIITFENNFTALLIENKDIADSYRTIFETMWEQVPDSDTQSL